MTSTNSLIQLGQSIHHHNQQSFGEQMFQKQDKLTLSDLKTNSDQLDSKETTQLFDKLFKENYLAVCQIYNELPVARLLKNVKYDYKSSISENLYGLSFSHNQFFRDSCLRQLIDILPEYKTLQGLKLEKINVSDNAINRLIEALPNIMLKELSLSGIQMGFFCFDNLISVIKNPNTVLEILDLSNTKLTEKNGIDLFEVILQESKIRSLNLSRNPGLGYKFSAYSLHLVKNVEEYSLNQVDLSYCGISQLHQKQINKIVSSRGRGQIIESIDHQISQEQQEEQEFMDHQVQQQQQQQEVIEQNYNAYQEQKHITPVNQKSCSKSNHGNMNTTQINLTSTDSFMSQSPDIPRREQSIETVNHFTPYHGKSIDQRISMSPISPIESSIGNHLKTYSIMAKEQQNLFEQTAIHNVLKPQHQKKLTPHKQEILYQSNCNSADAKKNKDQKCQFSSYNQRRNDSKNKRQKTTQQLQQNYDPQSHFKTFEFINTTSQTFDDRSILSTMSNIVQNTIESTLQQDQAKIQKVNKTTTLFKKPLMSTNPSLNKLNIIYTAGKNEPPQLQTLPTQSQYHRNQSIISNTSSISDLLQQQQQSIHTQQQSVNIKSSPSQPKSVYYNYQRNLRKQQKQQNCSSLAQSVSESMTSILQPQQQQQQSIQTQPNFITPQIIKTKSRISQNQNFSSNCSTESKNKSFSNIKKNEIINQQQQQEFHLKTERYSQSMQRKLRQRSTSNEVTQRNENNHKKTPTATRKNTSRNIVDPSSQIITGTDTNIPVNYIFVNKKPQNSNQQFIKKGFHQRNGKSNNRVQSYTSTRPSSTLNSKRLLTLNPSNSIEHLTNKENIGGYISKGKKSNNDKNELFNSINDVKQLKLVLKNEIERLQHIYQSIDNVLVQTAQPINSNYQQNNNTSAFSTVSFKRQ